ncbi:MAG: DUF4124 domain-containing protein [Methylobacter sp.]|nr:DUF4124 domain-containing protein [Methylobacter sp.]
MNARLLLLLCALSAPAQAEVFKCVSDGRARYQPTPCAGAESTPLDIKQRTPEQDAAARANLYQWQSNYQAYETARAEAVQRLHEQRLREDEVRAQQLNAHAQWRQAQAQRHQAAALERSNIINRQLLIDRGRR